MNDTTQRTPSQDAEHDAIVELIPWLHNGSLASAERARVDAHLQQCARCRAEWQLEGELATVLNNAAAPVPAPQPALRQLMARIEREHAAPVHARAVQARARMWRRDGFKHWLPMLMPGLVAACAALAVFIGLPSPNIVSAPDEPSFHTLSSQSGSLTSKATPVTLRIVFADSVTGMGAESIVKDLGGKVLDIDQGSATVVAVWRNQPARDAALQRLRARIDVRFAEPGAPARAAPQ